MKVSIDYMYANHGPHQEFSQVTEMDVTRSNIHLIQRNSLGFWHIPIEADKPVAIMIKEEEK